MKADVLIKGGKIFTPGGIFEASLVVDGGEIAAFTTEPELVQADLIVDVKGGLILPGVMDSHVHFREPGLTHKEDFSTGSQAAAFGGVTTVMDMPNTKPPTVDGQAFQAKKEAAEKKAYVDFGLWGGISSDNLAEAPSLKKAGAVGVKMMASARERAEGASIFSVPESGWEVLAILKTAVSSQLLVGVHAENSRLAAQLENRLRQEGRRDPAAHSEAKPSPLEAAEAARVLLTAKMVGARLHLVHATSRESVGLVRWAKASGFGVTAETCPHYLLLTQENLRTLGPAAKVNPPLRSREDGEALWEALAEGTVDTLASDHAPHTPEEKERGWRDFWEAPSGFCGVETLLPLMLTQVNRGRLSLEKLVQLLSENPARIFGLYPRKGAVQVGAEADLVVVDMKRERLIRVEELHSRGKVSPWHGWRVRGVPVMTFVRGSLVVEEGVLVGKPGWGRMVKPQV
ncbi:allantoinase AllB [Candidatus Hecatella orcuttiae]|jgi:dihydroorotase (multifunctional complex type)|uniref:allantoinase AllB n=1 Tax=Candidatus Hecatella orcuttiae TaxID=1935119 RepID=UPI002868190A|nr:allantoinase AllB [Candidatus Hecatella orcuttiae]